MESQLFRALRQAQFRLRQGFCWRHLAALGACSAGLALLVWFSDQTVPRAVVLGFVLMLCVLSTMILISGFCRYRFLRDVAACVEDSFPDLEQRLFTCVTQLQRGERIDALTRMVLEQTASHGAGGHWKQVVSDSSISASRLLAIVSLVATGLLTWQVAQRPMSAAALQVANVPPTDRRMTAISVSPGNTEIERGSALVVSVTFGGGMPNKAVLRLQSTDGKQYELPMSQRLEDPVFAVQVPNVQGSFSYHVDYDEVSTDSFHVSVFDFPSLVQADAAIHFPEYTGQHERRVLDTRRVTAVEGSSLTWITHLNKPVKRAWLEDSAGENFLLQPSTEHPGAYELQVHLSVNSTWKLHLEDHQHRRNKYPPQFAAVVPPNQRPQIELAAARDLTVSPIEEIDLQATVWDDFGVKAYGIEYSFAAGTQKEFVLGSNHPANQKQIATYRLDFEALNAKPNQLLAFYFWADDIGPDASPRRTRSDMFFAEVRHFEETFRKREATLASDQAAPKGKSENLLELQKQIVTGTWNLSRQPAIAMKKWKQDLESLIESQQTARGQLAELASENAAQVIGEIEIEMDKAIVLLDSATEDDSKLLEALNHEQAAYQGLLELRNREHQVARGQSSGSSQGGNRRQIEDLELDSEERRYEKQRQATQQSEADQTDRETRQVLNRLRELARRQKDINEQLRDLQLSLKKDLPQDQRDEIQRQLKRLRDQQEEMIRDADETEQRANAAQDQPGMRETREQLSESRDRLQQSKQATADGNVGQALAAGTRVERQFDDMAETLRQNSASRFSEQMKELVERSKNVHQQQNQIQQELEKAESATAGLRSGPANEKAQQLLDQQASDISHLMEDIEQTIRDAEAAEPLLAQKLYDALRRANQNQLTNKLETTKALLENGLRPQARELNQDAMQGVDELGRNVNEAAKGIVPNELEALRRAAGILSDLAEQLQREKPVVRTPSDSGVATNDRSSSNASTPSAQEPPSNDLAGLERDSTKASKGLLSALDGDASGPITGTDFAPWSDQLRDIEEMVGDAELSTRAAQIRDRARQLRRESHRKSRSPQWSLVEELVATPLEELRKDVDQELARRSGQNQSLVPIDRDPVPELYRQRVQEYYERLGTGQ